MANVKISELTAATTVSGSDTIPVVQGGATKKATIALLADTHTHDAANVPLSATGLSATNVEDGLIEILGMSTDSGTMWSGNAKSLANTTLSADTDLNVPIAANERIWLDWYFTFTGATAGTANLKATLSVPAGATGTWGSALDYDAAGSAGAAKGLLGVLTDTKTFKLANGTIGVHIRALVVNGTTAGNVVINLAQNTTDATPVTRDAWARVVWDKVKV